MAHWLSTLLLCLLVLLVAFLLTLWVGARQPSDAWKIGALWLALTLGFEFLAGHYLFRNSWQKLLADYDVLAGRVWVFVPIVTLVAPRLALAVHGS